MANNIFIYISGNYIYILEIVGTVAFAFWGAQRAIANELDLFGIYFAGICTAVGGGIVRDCILGNTPPMAFRFPSYALCGFLTITILVFFNKQLNTKKMHPFFITMLNSADALGLGIFAVVGVNNAISCGFASNAFLCVFCGVCTAVGGGLLRDTFINCNPTLLSKEIYATAAIVGSVFYYYMQFFLPGAASVAVSVVLISGIRLWAIFNGLDLPRLSNG